MVSNTYGFSAGDPVNYSDPFGLDCRMPTTSSPCDWDPVRAWNGIKATARFLVRFIQLSLVGEGCEGQTIGGRWVACGSGPAVGGKFPSLTRWGWSGTAKWRAARDLLNVAGTHEEVLKIVPTEAEARELIKAGGGAVERVEEGHSASGVSPHTYPHINYVTHAGEKATVRILELPSSDP